MRTLLCLLLVLPLIGTSQDQNKALNNVEAYIKANSEKPETYKRIKMHECFVQDYGDDIAKDLGTKRKIKYSLSLTYSLENITYEFRYFHLDKNYDVVGVLDKDAMFAASDDMLSTLLEDMNPMVPGKAIDSAKFENKVNLPKTEFNREATYLIKLKYIDSDFEFYFNMMVLFEFLSNQYRGNNVMYQSKDKARLIGEAILDEIEKGVETLNVNQLIEEKNYQDGAELFAWTMRECKIMCLANGTTRAKNITKNKMVESVQVVKSYVQFENCLRKQLLITDGGSGDVIATWESDDYSKKGK